MNKTKHTSSMKCKTVLNAHNVFPMGLLLFFFIFALTLLPAYSQVESREFKEKNNALLFPWEIYVGGSFYRVPTLKNWYFGPEITVQRALSKNFGLYATLSYLAVKTSKRGYDYREGFPVEGGFWLAILQEELPLKIGAGLNYIFGSDSDGGEINELGFHISTHGTYWLNDKWGIYLKGVLRFWPSDKHSSSTFSPSISAGIGFRF
jgi:hypothetical protein